MAEEHSQGAGKAMADQPPPCSPLVLDYRSARVEKRWYRGPWPSWITVVALLVTAAAGYWLARDHAAWVVVRQFDGAMQPRGAPGGIISADGKRLLAVLADRQTIRVYDVATGKTVRDFRRPTGEPRSASFSPDGSHVWSSNFYGPAILWDVPSGQTLATVVPSNTSDGFFDWLGAGSPFSPDGRLWVAATDRPSMLICGGHSGAVLTKLPRSFFPAFSPDSRYLAALSSPPVQVRIWDTQTWQQVALISCNNESGISDGDAHRFAFSPDSKTLAIAAVTHVDLWDAATNQVSQAFTTTNSVYRCAFPRDGHYLVTSGESIQFEIWDMTTHKHVGVLTPGSSGWPVISPDGSRIVVSSESWRFPSLTPLPGIEAGHPVAWLPGQHAFISEGQSGWSRLSLVHRRRPEAVYGLAWLPQFWLVVLGVLATAWLIVRDVKRWRRSPPAL